MHYKAYKSILSAKNNMNLYRGCTHGCIYCDSRSACYNMQHAFEDIEVKTDAPEMLAEQLRRKRKKGMISTGAMSDPYMPIEAELGYMRRCLEAVLKEGFGICVQTKSAMVLRDLDLLVAIHEKTKCVVEMTLTTYDEALCRKLEPHVSTTAERFEALMRLKEAGVPTVVWLSPILPYINDTVENVKGILDLCVTAGVHGILYFGAGVTLREGNREFFYKQLDRHFPGLKAQYERAFGRSYVCTSPNARQLDALVRETCTRHDMLYGSQPVFDYLHTFEEKEQVHQLTLF
ncbi:radical SAM protein [Fusibacter sp. JL298sf-3]